MPSSPKNVTQQKGFFVDKTDEGFDRAQFMLLLKRTRKVKAVATPTRPKPKSVVIASPTRTVFKFVRKINRRMKLKSKVKPPRKVRKSTLSA